MNWTEAQTRKEIIDKLLVSSGWDIEDPTRVVREFDISVDLPEGVSLPVSMPDSGQPPKLIIGRFDHDVADRSCDHARYATQSKFIDGGAAMRSLLRNLWLDYLIRISPTKRGIGTTALLLIILLVVAPSSSFARNIQILEGPEAIAWLVKFQYISQPGNPTQKFGRFWNAPWSQAHQPGEDGLLLVSADPWDFPQRLSLANNPVIVVDRDLERNSLPPIPIPIIAGPWNTTYVPNGTMARYQVQQNGNRFSWSVYHPDITEQVRNGVINGNQVSIEYNRTRGPHSTNGQWVRVTGNVILDSAGNVTKIDWGNGVVWMR